MPARESLDDKLASLRSLRGQTISIEQKTGLRKRIGDRSNLVVAAAAAIAGENTLAELAKDLEAAFNRFLVNPVKDDKLCRAKIAIVQALDRMEHPDPDVFRKASRHVQLEPVWGGVEDSASPLRAAALVSLRGSRVHSPCQPWRTPWPTPPETSGSGRPWRSGPSGRRGAGLILRLKVRLGDRDPDVLSECLGALLAVEPRTNLLLVSEFLKPADEAACEAAAMALGRSRLAEAFAPLRDCWERAHSSELKHHLLLCLAILRRPVALDFLADLVASGPVPDAIAALSALKIYKNDPRLRNRIAELVEGRESERFRAEFDRAFGPG